MLDIEASVGVKDGRPCYNQPKDQKIVMDLPETIEVSRGGVKGNPNWKRPSDRISSLPSARNRYALPSCSSKHKTKRSCPCGPTDMWTRQGHH
jgi:hypothetical protein